MKQSLFFLVAITCFAIALPAEPNPAQKPKQTANAKEKGATNTVTVSSAVAQSANGWYFAKGEWVHPDGYKFANGKVLRTTARPGRAYPQAPGKLALENADKLNRPMPTTTLPADLAAKPEDKAAAKTRNKAPRPAPQTGSHL